MGFNVGDRVRFPDPLKDGVEIEGFFLDVATEVARIEVPGATHTMDDAWVWRDDGTTARVPYGRIRPAKRGARPKNRGARPKNKA